MKRREFIRSAALVAGANATTAFATAAPINLATNTSTAMPAGKIALEEHFMVPDFIEFCRNLPEHQP